MSKVKTRGRQSSVGKIIIVAVVMIASVVCVYAGIGYRKQNNELLVEKKALDKELDEVTVERQELEDLEKYMSTDAYYEDQAKKKLGLVHPDEIVIRPSEE